MMTLDVCLSTVLEELIEKTTVDVLRGERARVAGLVTNGGGAASGGVSGGAAAMSAGVPPFPPDPGRGDTMSVASSVAISGAAVAVSAGQQNSRAG